MRYWLTFALFLFLLSVSNAEQNTTIDTIILQTACGQTATWCSEVLVEDDLRYRFRLNNRIVEEVVACNFQMSGFYAPISEAILSNDFAPFFIDRWRVDDRFFSGEILSIDALIDSLNRWDEAGNWRFDAANERVVGGDERQQYGDLSIEIITTNTTLTANYNPQQLPRNIGLSLPMGTNRVSITDLFTATTEDYVIQVVCTTTDSLTLNLSIGDSRIICLDEQELMGERSTITTIETETNLYSWRPTTENCIEIRGNLNGSTAAIFIQCDANGICDSTFVNLIVQPSLNRTYQATLRVGEEADYCLENQRLLPGAWRRFENECDTTTIANFQFYPITNCLRYRGEQVGKTNACWAMEDEFGNRDSLHFKLTIVEPEYVTDTLFVGIEEGFYCFDLEAFNNIISIEQACEATAHVNFELDVKEYCLSYTGESVGTDSTCVWIVDDEGNASLTVVYVTIVQPTTATVSTELFINEQVEICVATDELPGQINNFFNLCPLESGEKTTVTIQSENCVEIVGREVGTERACLVACDDLGFCDTTFLQMTVIDYTDLPDAVNDQTRVNQNGSIIIPVQDNDDLTGGISVISIGTAPENGSVIINGDGTISYFPDRQNCTGSDLFTYFICNNIGCDEATVTIIVDCNELEIFNGMSPNGDGINDTFFIANLDAQNANYLQIFNRWGHLVFEQKDYQNDWQGTWNGKALPDGTYFYALEVENNEGETINYRGSIELHR